MEGDWIYTASLILHVGKLRLREARNLPSDPFKIKPRDSKLKPLGFTFS